MMLIGAGSVVQAAEKITDYTQIVSGKKYYIGATTGGTDYYFFAAGTYNATQIAGSAKTDKAEAVVLTFEGSGTQWTVKFDSGKYLTLPSSKQNGKVNVVSDPATWTLSNQSGNKIRMAASSGFSLQKNNSGTQFGSYGNTQTDVWLEEYEENVTPTCATPTFSLAEGAVYSGTKVAISTTTTGATIYYTTDGTTPTTSSSVYSDSIEITEATTIKAFAVKTDYNDSEVATAAYTIKQLVQVTGYTIDFENDIDAYVDWTFENVGNTNTAITAYGGSKYGANINDSGNGVATLKIQTKEKVALPNELTCYVSKVSTNTSSSTWTISVSEDGTNWTDIETHSAASMSKGEWQEFTANLSSYNDVYARISYSGSTAIRAIDDISLTMRDPNAKVTPTIVIDATSLTNDLAGGTNVSAGTATAAVMDGQTAVENVSVTWSSSNTDVATIDATTGAVTLIATGTTTLTASFAGNDEYNEASGTYELTVIDSNAAGGANNPYTVAQALENTPDTGNSSVVYVKGIVSGFYNDGENILADYSHRYYISDDGTSSNTLMVYNGKGLGNVAFSNADDVLIGDEVVICGMLTNYNGTKEFAKDNYIVSQERVEYYLTGTFNSWSDIFSEMEKLEKNNEGKYSTTMTISENTEFKIIRKNLDGSLTWIGAQAEGSYYLVLSDGDIQMNENGGQNVKFETAGEYTFTFDVTTYKLNVTGFPAPPVPVYYLKGDFNNWGNDDPFVHQGNGIYTISKHVGATQAFKIVDENDGWYSNNSFSRDNCTELGLYTNNSNMTTGVEGDFVFTLNTAGSTMTLTVTGWPTTIDGNMFVRVISDTDLTDGAYLIVYEDGNVAFDGSLTTLDATNNTIDATISNGTIVGDATTMASLFYIEGNTNKTIKSASGLYIGNTSNSNDLEESDVTAYTNTITIEDGYADIYSSGGAHLRYNSANDQARFRYYKSSSYSSQQAIQLYKLVTVPMNDIVITSAEWATYVPNLAVTIPEDVTAYIVTNATSTSVTLSSVASAPANTGLVVNGAQGTYTPTAAETTDDVSGNLLVVSDGTVVGNGNIYALGNKNGSVGFKKVKSGVTVPAGKPYLTIENTGSKDFFDFSFDEGVATGIESIESVGFDMNAPVYDLQGRQVNRLHKGVFIQNGKKIIVK